MDKKSIDMKLFCRIDDLRRVQDSLELLFEDAPAVMIISRIIRDLGELREILAQENID